jgi:hypothetical protein
MGKWKQHQDGGSKKRPKYNSKVQESMNTLRPCIEFREFVWLLFVGLRMIRCRQLSWLADC